MKEECVRGGLATAGATGACILGQQQFHPTPAFCCEYYILDELRKLTIRVRRFLIAVRILDYVVERSGFCCRITAASLSSTERNSRDSGHLLAFL
jgi:hypothetical protein